MAETVLRPGCAERIAQLESSLRTVIRGNAQVIRLTLVALLAEGHILIEGVPGVGKTTLAHALARVLDCGFQRLQCTSDMLPGDVLGTSIWSTLDQRFEFKPGPVFTNVLLADELNRTTPKTQSALLEAMAESQVTVDGQSYPLPQPFLVVATQNPVEHHGTYFLPESQLDRFLLRIEMRYPDAAEEREILRAQAGTVRLDELQPVLSAADMVGLQQEVRSVHVDDAIIDYLLAVVQRTRNAESLSLGVSPRGSLMLHRAAQAHALVSGRRFVTPADVQDLIVPVFAHRVVVRQHGVRSAAQQAEALLREIVAEVPVPV